MLAVVVLGAFTLAVGSHSALLGADDNTAVQAQPRAAEWWVKRHEAMNKWVAKADVELIMIGDSITQGWEGAGRKVWEKRYKARKAVNLGISGDRTQHVLWRLQNGNIKGISPKLAVIMIGTNNSGDNTGEEIAAGITAIVDLLQKQLPKTEILLLGVFPRGATPQDQRRQVNQQANEIIAQLDQRERVTYLDIGGKFLAADGTLTREVMPDLLHLNPASYQTWAEAIEPVVSKVLGPMK
jgi:beta-glucosidase